MDNLLESIEDVKEKLTSAEYKKLMEGLGEFNKSNQPVVKIEIFGTDVTVIKDEYNGNNDYTHKYDIQSKLRHMIFTQKEEFKLLNHEVSGDYYLCDIDHLQNNLSEENLQLLYSLC